MEEKHVIKTVVLDAVDEGPELYSALKMGDTFLCPNTREVMIKMDVFPPTVCHPTHGLIDEIMVTKVSLRKNKKVRFADTGELVVEV